MEHTKEMERLTGLAYDTYCEAVGGVAFNGDPLPDWAEFGSDSNKEKQANAWRKTVLRLLLELGRAQLQDEIFEKVRAQKEGIDKHLESVSRFIQTNTFKELDLTERELIQRQADTLDELSDILYDRLTYQNGKPNAPSDS